uniref:Serine/threonine-protein phosphatase n=1 Tax=Chromera velia CCMP2878 TaxID=1169474 RepID=A0A0G4HGF2_9ALVE|eukprot:Cvel_27210.t1-p1 / transcript=Cvel_27210.t1 / gene=Cvel_27210 / organism=Chromera_velia_CCMP2878 / gene_product=Calcineurin subunit A, putative / transcript_product=Calcineurin subunit A, putative / location=Cvel_scaffold3362:2350-9924(-) / protein_length=540 / sequence_SO=supercontig / SO=protein_coding / is_pseudo=false
MKDRALKDLEPPPALELSEEFLFPNPSKRIPDWQCLRHHLIKEGKLHSHHIHELVRSFMDVTSSEGNVLKLRDPITIVGDIHGQFYDFVKLLDVGGSPENTQYLFLGDYVDRGSFSVECIVFLCALKLNFPTRIWLLRGNHECRQMTAFFNFRDECEYKYDLNIYNAFMDCFDTLPIAATVNGKFLGVHGGLSPDLRTMSQLSSINRFMEPPRNGLFCDILWSDPADEEKEDHVAQMGTFFPNDVRGCSFFFGCEAAAMFLEKNQLLSIIRAHEAQLEGYKMHQTNARTGFPTVITIFSAPNYCDCYNNKGAVLKFENNTLNIQQFNYSPHPYHLPNFMDVFAWSIPFVSEKVTEMLYAILRPSVDELSDDDDDEDVDSVQLPPEIRMFMRKSLQMDSEEATELRKKLTDPAAARTSPSKTPGAQTSDKDRRERAAGLRKKVQSVSRMMRLFKTLRQQHELVVKLKGLTPGHRIPIGVLSQGREGLENELARFQKIKSFDAVNEKRPADDAIPPPRSASRSSTASLGFGGGGAAGTAAAK